MAAATCLTATGHTVEKIIFSISSEAGSIIVVPYRSQLIERPRTQHFSTVEQKKKAFKMCEFATLPTRKNH